MRATPEMVDTLWHALGKTVARETVERGLSTALADVPERSIDAATVALRHVREEIPEAFLREHDGYIFAAVAGMAARIAELEAQLARVRAVAASTLPADHHICRALEPQG